MKMKLLAAAVAASALATANVNAAGLDDVKVTTKGGLKVESGDCKFQIGGRIQYDYARSELNGDTQNDGFDVRRARIFIKGNVSKYWGFKAQANLDGDGGDDNFEDLYLQYTGFGKGAVVTIGNSKQPYGLEEVTSSKDISFLERAAITELFAVGRQEGVKVSGALGNNQYYGIGAYLSDDDDSDDELGFTARYSIAPVKTDRSVVHLGLGYSTIEETDAFNLEVAATSGSFHVQAEYYDGEFNDEDADGFYVQAGYILTGETRPYKGGKFKRIKPNSKAGAWEIVARYEDGNGEFDDIELGDQVGASEVSSYGIGLNYYANDNIRIGVNYTDGDSDNTSDDGNEFRLRFQVTYQLVAVTRNLI